MTSMIFIDESGDLGSNGTKYFAIAAIVTIRARHLKSVSKLIDMDGEGRKWSASNHLWRSRVLEKMSDCNFKVVYSIINKNDPDSKHPIYGNELYEMMIRQVVIDSLSVLETNDVNLFVDRSRFIKIERFKEISREESYNLCKNLKKCDKLPSEQAPCGRVVDFVVGAVRSHYENNDDSINIIRDKVSVARKY